MSGWSNLTGASERIHESCGCFGHRLASDKSRFQFGSTRRKYERSRPFAVRHMALDLDIDFKGKSVQGSASLDFSRRAPSARELRLDALGFVIEQVQLALDDGPMRTLSQSTYTYDGDCLIVPLDETVETGRIIVSYRATPRLGLYFLEPDARVPDRPVQVWSQCQDEDGKHWFPCQDKPHVKMTYEMRVRVPGNMTVLSGGKMVSKRKVGKRAEFHFRLDEPTPAYLVTLVAGTFDQWSETVKMPSGRQVELRYLVPPGKTADGKRSFEITKEAMLLFSETTGVEYPYESYTQVVVSDFIFGGMENTTATTMYEHILLDKTAALDMDSHDLVAHELAHHWFGDLVTCRDWSHGWLNEGFATYFEHIERQRRLGLDEYEHFVTVDLNIYLGEANGSYQRAIVCRDYKEPIDLFDRHLYQKGGLVLHMLRRRLGDEAFFGAIRDYLTKHQGGVVETTDLMRALEEKSGLSLERFFDEWVYRPGHPSLKVNITVEKNELIVDIEQTQKGKDVDVFELPFEVEIGTKSGTRRAKRLITERKASIVVQLEERPQWVCLDPEYLIAAPIHLSAPADLLHGLLRAGPRARARRMAALALGRRQDVETVEALGRSLNDEDELWMVRSKCAESLGKIGGLEAEAQLRSALFSSNLKVQKAIAEALGNFRTTESTSALLSLTKSKSYLVTAASARSLGKKKAPEAPKVLRQLLQRSSWADVIVAGALLGLSKDPSPEVVDLLLSWAEYGRPLRARRAALAALSSVGEGTKVRLALEELLLDKDPHIRAAVLTALSAVGDPKAKDAIGELLDRELDGGVKTRAQEVLKELTKESNSGVGSLKDENVKLKQEIQALGRRLSKLEQKASSASTASNQTKTSGSSDGAQPRKASSKKASSKKASSKKASPKKTGR